MKLKHLVMNAGLSLLMALPAVGAQKEMVTVVRRTKGILEDSSEHRRMHKDYQITAQMFGFSVAPFPAVGMNFGMFLDRNDVLQLEYAKGAFPLIILAVTAQTVGVNWKHFYGNSFYTKLGVDHRQIAIEDTDYRYSTSTAEGTASALTGNIAIGNQWQWENFTLGCDWIGYNPSVLPLESRYRTADMTLEEARETEDDWRNVAKANSLQMMRFYLGASF